MYTLLHEVNHLLNRNVITLEDPIEQQSEKVLQVQVNERAGITYATGLKAILRHDPDIIMVGEIRDAETAQIAVRAALTGHSVRIIRQCKRRNDSIKLDFYNFYTFKSWSWTNLVYDYFFD